MNTDVAFRLGQATGATEPGRGLRRGWSAVTASLVAGVFLEAIFAGAMLSGAGWARAAHGLNAGLLVVSTLTAGLVAVVTLRRVPNGPGLAVILLSLAATLVLQAALGAFIAKGANLTWLHVPLGVALLAFAGQAAARARRLGGD